MRFIAPLSILFITLIASACGTEIGDECSSSTDCSPSGDLICDLPSNSPGGYCTVLGCDYDSCPEGGVCVRFFSVGSTNVPCEETADCSSSELCTMGGFCVPAVAETRYCMKTCEGEGDCRDKYECRDRELMLAHGGEIVSAPGESSTQRFCAVDPAALEEADDE